MSAPAAASNESPAAAAGASPSVSATRILALFPDALVLTKPVPARPFLAPGGAIPCPGRPRFAARS